tara:strand:+ start:3725 stop:3946 length:222 start_codon:yes stop_codon:yes gene_type:complete
MKSCKFIELEEGVLIMETSNLVEDLLNYKWVTEHFGKEPGIVAQSDAWELLSKNHPEKTLIEVDGVTKIESEQ